MPTVIATALVERATTILIDAGNIRWGVDELIGWLNDGQRAVVMRRPDANAIFVDMNCVAGSKQELPENGLRLIDVPRNSIGGAVTLIDRSILDTNNRQWHQLEKVTEIEHFCYDDRNPLIFWVFPPAEEDLLIDIIYSESPADVVVTLGNETITIPDVFANALLEYMLYRAFQKDAEFGANPQRAGLHWQAFLSEIGDSTQADTAMSPAKNG